MRWSERQLAMLREVGVHIVVRPAPIATTIGPPTDTPHASAPAALVAEERRAPAPVPARAVAAPAAPAAPLKGRPSDASTISRLPRADWLVVAELDDDRSGEGDEARLLANMLRAIGVSEDPDVADAARRAARVDPRRLDTDALARALEDTGARAVLALGKGAAKVLLGSDEPLGRLRGTAHRTRSGVPVIVSWPPSYLLRHPDEKSKAWADLCLAVATVDAVSS